MERLHRLHLLLCTFAAICLAALICKLMRNDSQDNIDYTVLSKLPHVDVAQLGLTQTSHQRQYPYRCMTSKALDFDLSTSACFAKGCFACCEYNSDCRFGKGRADAEKFLGALQDVYCLERVRILGDDLRLLKCYPGNWQVTPLSSVT